MAARLSIVIPTLNAAGPLPVCLAALVEGAVCGLVCDLTVSDGGSDDATLEMADEAGARIVTGPPSRGAQLHRGAQSGDGDWILFLHADTVLDPDWSSVVSAHIRSGGDGAACFRLAFDETGRRAALVAGWANLRSRVFGLPYGDQGLLISRRLYTEVGGYPDQPLMEDVEIARRLGRSLTVLQHRATTSADRYRRDGWFRRGSRNLWTLARYLAGADPEQLARRYRR